MSANSVSYYVASMSEEGVHYRIRVTVDAISCECGGSFERYCSHIEATMIAGERAMVHQDDRTQADRARTLFAGAFIAPPDWKSAWRRNLRWRGLSSGLVRQSRHIGQSGKPVVCFTGNVGVPRAMLLRQAIDAGWEAIDSPHSKTTVLVAADPAGSSTKLRFARRHGIPTLAFAEWEALMTEGVFPDCTP